MLIPKITDMNNHVNKNNFYFILYYMRFRVFKELLGLVKKNIFLRLIEIIEFLSHDFELNARAS